MSAGWSAVLSMGGHHSMRVIEIGVSDSKKRKWKELNLRTGTQREKCKKVIGHISRPISGLSCNCRQSHITEILFNLPNHSHGSCSGQTGDAVCERHCSRGHSSSNYSFQIVELTRQKGAWGLTMAEDLFMSLIQRAVFARFRRGWFPSPREFLPHIGARRYNASWWIIVETWSEDEESWRPTLRT